KRILGIEASLMAVDYVLFPIMGLPGLVALLVLVLMLAKWAAQLWLEHLNRRHVLAHANAVPDAFKNIMDEAAYAKSVQYTLAKSRLHQIETTYHLAVLA